MNVPGGRGKAMLGTSPASPAKAWPGVINQARERMDVRALIDLRGVRSDWSPDGDRKVRMFLKDIARWRVVVRGP